MFRRILAAVLVVLSFSAPNARAEDPPAPPAQATAEHVDKELSSDVPALFAFHEVIMPLWHDAWPAKNLDLMRELVPGINGHVAAIQKVELPGILRDKQAKWDEGVADCASYASKLEAALAANEQQAALDAAESLHAAYEGLVRTVRPRLKELDAYHQELYRAYHYDWPQRNLDALSARAEQMAGKCEALKSAGIPKRYEAKEAKLRAGFTELCAATGNLQAACAAREEKGIGEAVEKVHAAYQACETLFE